jgi:hypothetical protein
MKIDQMGTSTQKQGGKSSKRQHGTRHSATGQTNPAFAKRGSLPNLLPAWFIMHSQDRKGISPRFSVVIHMVASRNRAT